MVFRNIDTWNSNTYNSHISIISMYIYVKARLSTASPIISRPARFKTGQPVLKLVDLRFITGTVRSTCS